MGNRSIYYEAIGVTKNDEVKKLWCREYYATGFDMTETIIVGSKIYESTYDFYDAFEDNDEGGSFSERGEKLPFIEIEDCCSVFIDELTENMKFVLDELKLSREDIETIYYTYECCYGYVTEDYEKTALDNSNAKEILEEIKKRKAVQEK